MTHPCATRHSADLPTLADLPSERLAVYQIEPVIVGSSAWMISSPLVTLPTAMKSSGATGAVKTPATAWIAIATVVILDLWFQANVFTPYRPRRCRPASPG